MSCGIVQWLSDKLLAAIQPKGSTPLPSGVIGALFFSMFGHAVAMQLLFAFLPDMIKSFGIADEDAGYYVGMVASAVFLGRFFSSYFWGWLSDKIGRRPVLLMCTGLLALTSVAFGFSKSFEVALVIRLITGLFGAVPAIVKASLTDICDDSNQALGMSVVVTAWNSGLIIGPAVGGYLAKPASKYSLFKNISFFENFAYLLPCLANAAISFFSFLLVFFLLPETLVVKRKNKEKDMQPKATVNTKAEAHKTSSNRQRTSVKTSTSQNDTSNSCQSKQQDEDLTKEISFEKSIEMHLLSGSVSFVPEMHLQSYEFGSRNSVEYAEEEPYVLTTGKAKPGVLRKAYKSLKQSKLAQLCRNKDVRCCICLYTISSFAVIAEHEMYSVWAATGREFGGLAFDTNELGFTLMVVGVGCAVSNCLVFPQMVKIFGVMKTQFITLITTLFFIIVLPTTNILYGSVLKAAVIVILLMIRVSSACCFTGQFIMIGNSVASHLRAAVHGLSTSTVCGARAISPTLAGSLFSWSITSGLGFPFNEKLVFIFIGFVTWLALLNACCLDNETVTKRLKH